MKKLEERLKEIEERCEKANQSCRHCDEDEAEADCSCWEAIDARSDMQENGDIPLLLAALKRAVEGLRCDDGAPNPEDCPFCRARADIAAILGK